MDKFYVIGKNISYSLSPQIHKKIGELTGMPYSYEIQCISEEKIEEFFGKKDFTGCNVTVPYKKIAKEKCDVLSLEAEKTGSVNTVKNVNGRLYGYNTDIQGFLTGSELAGFDYNDSIVLVLGTGGAASSVKYALESVNAKEIRMISRTGKDPFNYNCISEHFDAEYIINATPVGMENYGTDKAPISLEGFSKCRGVFDLIYSPPKTKLLSDAETRGISGANGYAMLVSQAVLAGKIFQNATWNEIDLIKEILKQ